LGFVVAGEADAFAGVLRAADPLPELEGWFRYAEDLRRLIGLALDQSVGARNAE
jgi:hypothetical protein